MSICKYICIPALDVERGLAAELYSTQPGMVRRLVLPIGTYPQSTRGRRENERESE